jgi:hypothetical protein
MSVIDKIKNKLQHFRRQKQLQERLRKDYDLFNKMSGNADRHLPVRWEDRRPMYEDVPGTSFDTHYFYHTAWAARIIAKTQPKKHIDVSGILYFSGILSAFIPVELYEYRPAPLKGLSNLISGQANLTDLHFATDSIESISCLHVGEHIGLGRYGDAIDPGGDINAINELKRVTAGGQYTICCTDW